MLSSPDHLSPRTISPNFLINRRFSVWPYRGLRVPVATVDSVVKRDGEQHEVGERGRTTARVRRVEHMHAGFGHADVPIPESLAFLIGVHKGTSPIHDAHIAEVAVAPLGIAEVDRHDLVAAVTRPRREILDDLWMDKGGAHKGICVIDHLHLRLLPIDRAAQNKKRTHSARDSTQ